jgi:hypothetical protein
MVTTSHSKLFDYDFVFLEAEFQFGHIPILQSFFWKMYACFSYTQSVRLHMPFISSIVSELCFQIRVRGCIAPYCGGDMSTSFHFHLSLLWAPGHSCTDGSYTMRISVGIV